MLTLRPGEVENNFHLLSNIVCGRKMHVKADLSPFPSWLKRTALPSQLVMTGGEWSVLKWRGDVYFPTWCFVCCFKRLIQQQRNCSANILALVFWAAAGKLPEAGLGQKCSPRGIWPGVPDRHRHPVYLWATGQESKSCTYFRPMWQLQTGSLPFFPTLLICCLWCRPFGLPEELGATFSRPLVTSAFCWNVPPGLGVWTPLPNSCLCMPFPSQNLICSFLQLWSFLGEKKSTWALGYHYWPLCVPSALWFTVGFLTNLRLPGPRGARVPPGCSVGETFFAHVLIMLVSLLVAEASWMWRKAEAEGY